MRQFQVEVGSNRVRLPALSAAAVGATRLRLAADAVVSLGPESDGFDTVLPRSRRVLDEHTRRLVSRANDRRAMSSNPASIDATTDPDVGSDVRAAMRLDLDGATEVGDLPRRVLWASMFVNDLERRL